MCHITSHFFNEFCSVVVFHPQFVSVFYRSDNIFLPVCLTMVANFRRTSLFYYVSYMLFLVLILVCFSLDRHWLKNLYYSLLETTLIFNLFSIHSYDKNTYLRLLLLKFIQREEQNRLNNVRHAKRNPINN